jgi:amidophosphoribosyltransferase
MCAIFGIVAEKSDPDLVSNFVLGLSAIQHRGYEAAGVVYSDNVYCWNHKDYGLVGQVFMPEIVEKINRHFPTIIIGQTRYSTSGSKSSRNIPPQWVSTLRGFYGLIHNGNIPAIGDKKRELEIISGFQVKFSERIDGEANDTEYMLKKIIYLAQERDWNILEAIRVFMRTTNGTYSSALMTENAVYIFRDPWGNRPLFYGISKDKNQFFFGSETHAFKHLSGVIPRELKPGRMLCVRAGQIVVDEMVVNKSPYAHCIFENIYFSKPSSRTFLKATDSSFRLELGRYLARLAPVPNADLVTDVPDSGRYAAEGFAQESNKPFISAFMKDSLRTFIQPTLEDRKRLAEVKYDLIPELVKDKVVVVLDDSIVRNVTMQRIVKMILEAGAKEVHVRISAPPTKYPCYYGIDIPDTKDLVAANHSVDEIRDMLHANSLVYITQEMLEECIHKLDQNPVHFCTACFNGVYPIPTS